MATKFRNDREAHVWAMAIGGCVTRAFGHDPGEIAAAGVKIADGVLEAFRERQDAPDQEEALPPPPPPPAAPAPTDTPPASPASDAPPQGDESPAPAVDAKKGSKASK